MAKLKIKTRLAIYGTAAGIMALNHLPLGLEGYLDKSYGMLSFTTIVSLVLAVAAFDLLVMQSWFQK